MDKDININITGNSIIKIIVFFVGAYLLWRLRSLVLILVTSIVIASSVEPAIKFLIRNKIPRVLGTVIMYVLSIGVFTGIVVAFIPPLLDETSGLIKEMPNLVSVIENGSSGEHFLPSGMQLNNLVGGVNNFVNDLSGNAFAFVSRIFGGVFTFVMVIVFSFYFSVQEDGVKEFLRIITPKEDENYAINLWSRSQKKIGLWMQGQLLLGVIIAALTYLGLMIVGIKYAFILAVLAGLFELIPVFGPILAAVPAVMIAFSAGGTSMAGVVTAIYLIIQQFENHLIYPLVVTKVVGVPPMMVIISLIVGAQLAGFLGILLSVPVAAVLQEILDDFDKHKHKIA